MVSTARLAEIGALIGDPARAAMMVALLEGRPLSARTLAGRAGVTPQTASGHLKKLALAGLVSVTPSGRQRLHQLATPDVGRLLESIHLVANGQRQGSVKRADEKPDLRHARSCYDHLAGELGVALAEKLAKPLEGEGAGLVLTPEGERRLAAFGIDLVSLRALRRPFCLSCQDWTERRPHLAGAVGAAILSRSLELGWLRRRQGTRALAISPLGQVRFRERFDIAV